MEFLLDPDVVFLNHGSFGACPKSVFDEYQRFQRMLESQPVRFLQRQLPDLLAAARSELAGFLGCGVEDVVFVSNPTYAVNEIARSLRLGQGDEVLTSNHEYGACSNAWKFLSQQAGFSVVEVPLQATIGTDDEFVQSIWSHVTERTRVIFLSHITSATALTLPVELVCAQARAAGILTVIDGAHVPGQLPLDIDEVGADFYVGTCHKWMCAPKGSAFLQATKSAQSLLDPLVVGWGWGPNRQFDSGSDFLDYHEWLGTDDPSAFLAVPAAIRFLRDHNWDQVQSRCHELAVMAVDGASRISGLSRVHDNERFGQMALIDLGLRSGAGIDPKAVQTGLYERHRIEVPIVSWRDPDGEDRVFLRASFQAYNSAADVHTLVTALNQQQNSWGQVR